LPRRLPARTMGHHPRAPSPSSGERGAGPHPLITLPFSAQFCPPVPSTAVHTLALDLFIGMDGVGYAMQSVGLCPPPQGGLHMDIFEAEPLCRRLLYLKLTSAHCHLSSTSDSSSATGSVLWLVENRLPRNRAPPGPLPLLTPGARCGPLTLRRLLSSKVTRRRRGRGRLASS